MNLRTFILSLFISHSVGVVSFADSVHTQTEGLPISTKSELQNQIIFTRIATDIRYFHPSDGVENTDWDKFLAMGMQAVTETPAEQLPNKLRELFSDIAPQMEINGEPTAIFKVPTGAIVKVWEQNGYIEEQDYDPELSVYQRKRIEKPLREVSELEFPELAKYGAVEVSIPMIQYMGSNGETLPLSTGFRSDQEVSKDLASQYTCKASVAKIWGVIQSFFPYFKSRAVNWEAELAPLLLSCEEGSIDSFFSALRRSLTKLGDNHLKIMTLLDERQFTVPVGFLWINEKIVAGYKANAEHSEIKIGDELIAVDGVATDELVERLEPLALTSRHRGKDIVAMKEIIRRKWSESVTLKFKNPSGVVYSVASSASEKSSDIFYATEDAYNFANTPLQKDLGRGIRYVNLSASKLENLASNIEFLRGAKAIVLDLRTYPVEWKGWRGLLAHFSNKEFHTMPLFDRNQTRPNQNGTVLTKIEQSITPQEPFISVPTVVLSSKFSISQNEHALGYVQNAGLPILGERTYGINGNVTLINILGGEKTGTGLSVRFTGMEATQNDGSDLIGVGIIPDIEVARTIEGVRNGDDEILKAAIKYLKEKI
ncbi:MAG: S41 family peptidase [Oligoflexales bacterium]